MTMNTVQIGPRGLPYNLQTTANGSYTLPQHVFIPHPSLQQLSGPTVNEPTRNGQSPATFAGPTQPQRPYPIPHTPNVYGIRTMNVKTST